MADEKKVKVAQQEQEEEGVAMIEYALLMALVAIIDLRM